MTQAILNGFQTLSPHLVVKDAVAAIEFYKKAFGAIEACRLTMPGSNQIMHAELKLGNSTLMLAGEFSGPECKSQAPTTLGGTPVTLHLYVENVDAAFQQAVAAGAHAILPPTDMFWGDRYGKLKDPFGHEWSLATHVRDLSPEEIQAGAEACFRQAQAVG